VEHYGHEEFIYGFPHQGGGRKKGERLRSTAVREEHRLIWLEF